MPKVSTFGLVDQVTVIAGNHVFAPNETIAALGLGWAGGTVTLPGPSSTPDDLPSNGDFYCVADPQGHVLGVPTQLVLDGGGYPLKGGPVFLVNNPFSELCATFDEAAQAWILEACGVGGD